GAQALSHHHGKINGWNEELVDGEVLRSDADHGEVNSFDAKVATDYRRIAGKIGLPKLVRNHGDGIATGYLAFFRKEAAAKNGLYAKSLEEIVAYESARANLRQRLGGTGDAESGQLKSDDILKGMRILAEVTIVGVRDASLTGEESVAGDGDDVDDGT